MRTVVCDSLAEGGRRCPAHTPSARRTGRAAIRIYGSDNAITRAAIADLDPEFVNGTIAVRAEIARTTTNQEIMKLAARDPKPAVVDALSENPLKEEIRLIRPAHGEDEEVAKQASEITLSDSPLVASNTGELTEPERDALASKLKDDRLNAVYSLRGRPLPDALLKDRSYEVRSMVASQTTDPAQLALLASDSDPRVRNAVLMNSAAPDAALHTLADAGHADARDTLDKRAKRRGEEPPPLSPVETARVEAAESERQRAAVESDAHRAAGDKALVTRKPFLTVAESKTSTAEQVSAAFADPNADQHAKIALARHRKSSDAMRLESLSLLNPADRNLVDWARRASDASLLEALAKHVSKKVRDEAKLNPRYKALQGK